MSIEAIKPGLQSTIVAGERTGFRSVGIGPGGALDQFAMSAANYLVGNGSEAPTLEMNFPAPEFFFNEDHLVSATGKGFLIDINDEIFSAWKAILVQKGSTMKFIGTEKRGRAYLSIHSGWKAQPWLGSFSTHLGVQAGGFAGRALKKGDTLESNQDLRHVGRSKALPWVISQNELDKVYSPFNEIRCVHSAESDLLSPQSTELFSSSTFVISQQSNRMGFRLKGEKLSLETPLELISSAVDFGTIQLLPDGNLIILMADHQTTGGYPRIASVIKSDQPKLGQMNPGDKISFRLISLQEAEKELAMRKNTLYQLRRTCLDQHNNYFKI